MSAVLALHQDKKVQQMSKKKINNGYDFLALIQNTSILSNQTIHITHEG